MLDVGEHLILVEEYYAPGSIGQFNLQFSVTVNNYAEGADATVGAITPELVVICMNSGSFATERGTSSTYTALGENIKDGLGVVS